MFRLNYDLPSSKPKQWVGLKLIGGYLGVTVFFVGLFCLAPLLVLPFYPEEAVYAKYFIVPGALSMLFGYLLSFLLKNVSMRQLEKHQDTFLVLLVWIIAIFICAMPFWLTGDYNLVQSLFESTSGFTTTGLSVVDVVTAPHIFLLHRSLMLFLGGVGLILVFTSVLSDRYGMRLYTSEGHNDKLLPNLVKSARLILVIYVFYIVSGIILYVIFGMPLFDAINHSIASVSTGGFSTEALSIGAYDSVAIEIVTIVLMLLGSTNFFVHYYLIKRNFKTAVKHSEIKFLVILTLLFLPILVFVMMRTSDYTIWESIRIGTFQYVSAITTTGFQNVSTFASLPIIFNAFMILLMLIGAGIGSTGGGIKQQRVLIAVKSIFWNIRDHLNNKRLINTNSIYKAGQKVLIDGKEQIDTYSFILIYLIIFAIGSGIFMAYGYPVLDSMFEFASSLGTVGLSMGITSYSAPAMILWTSIFGMFLGRLEIYIVLIAIFKGVSSLSKRVINVE